MTRSHQNHPDKLPAHVLRHGHDHQLSPEFQYLGTAFRALSAAMSIGNTSGADCNGFEQPESLRKQYDDAGQALYEIAFKIAECSAHDPDELAIKASVLLEYVEVDDTDLVSVLTRSLCTDFLAWLQTTRGHSL